MRALILTLIILIGAFVAVWLAKPQPATPIAAETASAVQWVTTTDPHQDPQVSPAPDLRTPPHP